MKRSWVAIQHAPFEGPGLIAEVAAKRGIELQPCHPYRGDPLPAMDEIDGLVVMGGPMSVSDTAEHPHLARETELIAGMVDAGRPVLGVCLGAQLLAHALGATVHRGEQAEIGFGSVSLTEAGREDPVLGRPGRQGPGLGASRKDPALEAGREDPVLGRPGREDPALDAGREDPVLGNLAPEVLPVMHWHEDTFDLPDGALSLARSALYPHQAFRVGERAYGLQFHLEVDRELADGWREHLPAGITLPDSSRARVEAVGRGALMAFFELAEA